MWGGQLLYFALHSILFLGHCEVRYLAVVDIRIIYQVSLALFTVLTEERFVKFHELTNIVVSRGTKKGRQHSLRVGKTVSSVNKGNTIIERKNIRRQSPYLCFSFRSFG